MPKLVCVVKSCESIPNKHLKKCEVDIGQEELLVVVTGATNVRVGSRVIVATIGTEIEVEGESIQIQKTNVGGVYSSGMFMDSVMLAWSGGAAGIAAQVPESFKPGDIAPTSKPRMDGVNVPSSSSSEPEVNVKDLKAKEKAERKALLAAKKEKRKEDKVAGKVSEPNTETVANVNVQKAPVDDDDEEDL